MASAVGSMLPFDYDVQVVRSVAKDTAIVHSDLDFSVSLLRKRELDFPLLFDNIAQSLFQHDAEDSEGHLISRNGYQCEMFEPSPSDIILKRKPPSCSRRHVTALKRIH